VEKVEALVKECKTIMSQQRRMQRRSRNLSVSAAMLDNGTYVYGVNIPRSGIICSEMVALGNSLLASPESDMLYIVTLLMHGDETEVVLPCGNCRQNLLYVYPNVSVVRFNNGLYQLEKIRDLLPLAYERK